MRLRDIESSPLDRPSWERDPLRDRDDDDWRSGPPEDGGDDDGDRIEWVGPLPARDERVEVSVENLKKFLMIVRILANMGNEKAMSWLIQLANDAWDEFFPEDPDAPA